MVRISLWVFALGLTACGRPGTGLAVAPEQCTAGVRWAVTEGSTRTLRVWLEVPSSATPAWKFERSARLSTVLDAWNSAGAPIRLVPAKSFTTSEIVVLVVDRLPLEGNREAHIHRAGVTHLTFVEGGHIGRARTFVAEHTPRGQPYATTDQMATLMHELGHALGLPHDAGAKTLMAARPVVDNPTPRDRMHARAYYAPTASCSRALSAVTAPSPR
ncbi:MAG: hypothetical protein H7066_18945 [Cytophagaceae bacterium]|nr:hypothetical protein [Gemmatimonadaceae bacterium]